MDVARIPVLYQFGTCPHSKTVRSVLAYKGVPFVPREVPLLGRRALRRLSQQDWPPVLVHEGRVLVHLREILSYLEAEFPSPAILPVTATLRSECTLLSHWIERGLHYLIVAVKYLNPANRAVALASVRRNYGRGLSRALVVALPFGQRIRLARFGYRAQHLPAIERTFAECCAALDARLGRQPYLVGDALTWPDIALHAAFWTLRGCVEEQRMLAHPHLAAWWSRIESGCDWVRA
jgi:glutathione S-transferase